MTTHALTITMPRAVAAAVAAVALLVSMAAGAPAQAAPTAPTTAAPIAHKKAKRAKHRRVVARASAAWLTRGGAFCRTGAIDVDPPAFTTKYPSDWVRWRVALYSWTGTTWSGPSYGAWTGWVHTDWSYGYQPPRQSIAARGGRYWTAQVQYEHYEARTIYTASNLYHTALSNPTGNGLYCYVP